MGYSYELLITIVNLGFSEEVMDAARQAGARGGTILHVRGTGSQAEAKFFGITIQPEKELVLIVAPKEHRTPIMQAICQRAGLHTPGSGITFSLPVTAVAGISGMTPDDETCN